MNDTQRFTLFRKDLLRWFAENRRPLPWRADYTPYRTWIAEVMMQQTQMDRGVQYFLRWMERFPDVAAVAAAPEEDLLKAWEGLGYYRRARNIQAAARVIMERHGGNFPTSYADILALPGVGPYTAGAIASTAYNEEVPCVDGNVERVLSRVFDIDTPVKEEPAKSRIRELAQALIPKGEARNFNQGLMELGALVCRKKPECERCPLAGLCQAHAAGTTAVLPQKAKPKPRKVLPVTVALVESPAGFLVQQRPAKGLLAGLWQPLLWESEHLLQAEVLARLAALGVDTGTAVPEALPAAKHIFSHIEWLLSGVALTVPEQAAPAGCVWASREELRTTYTLPGAFAAYKDRMLG